jgi:hypothetical protein
VQSQKDQVEAYSFMVTRMISALVTGDAARGEQPARRLWFGLTLGTALAVLAVAGFAVFGLISHSSSPGKPVPAGTGSVISQVVSGRSPTWPH